MWRPKLKEARSHNGGDRTKAIGEKFKAGGAADRKPSGGSVGTQGSGGSIVASSVKLGDRHHILDGVLDRVVGVPFSPAGHEHNAVT
jgi:hypothetical protein